MGSYEKKIWMYWENKKGYKKPAYLDLALETIKKNSGDYELVLLDEKSVESYITLSPFVKRISAIVQRSDIIRFNLLNKYGGIWLDSDMILLRDILRLKKLRLSDSNYLFFISFFRAFYTIAVNTYSL